MPRSARRPGPRRLDILHLTAGARYTQDKRDGILDMVQRGSGTAGWQSLPFNFDKGRFDPMVTAALDATPDIHLYAKYATGYRAGGANDRSATFTASVRKS